MRWLDLCSCSARCTSAIWSKNGFEDITSIVLATIAASARGDVSFQVSNAFAAARTASSLGGMSQKSFGRVLIRRTRLAMNDASATDATKLPVEGLRTSNTLFVEDAR